MSFLGEYGGIMPFRTQNKLHQWTIRGNNTPRASAKIIETNSFGG